MTARITKTLSQLAMVLMAFGILSQTFTGQAAFAQQDEFKVSALYGDWTIDVDATQKYLDEVDRSEEMEDIFLEIADSIILTFDEKEMSSSVIPPGTDDRISDSLGYTAEVKEENRIAIETDDHDSSGLIIFLDDDTIRFEPNETFPVILVRSKEEASDETEEPAEDEQSEMPAEAAKLMGGWRINLEMTRKHHEELGELEESELLQMEEGLEGLQVLLDKDGNFKVEISGSLMEGTWEFTSFDKETKTIKFVATINDRSRNFEASLIDESTLKMSPESDPDTILKRIEEDDKPTKSASDKDDDN